MGGWGLTAGDAGAGLLEALTGGHHRDGGRQHTIAHDHAHSRHHQHAQNVLHMAILHTQDSNLRKLIPKMQTGQHCPAIFVPLLLTFQSAQKARHQHQKSRQQ